MPVIVALAIVAALFARDARSGDAHRAPSWRYEIVATHPHDTTVFTQGLALLDGRLLESAGQYGRSRLTLRDVATGAIARERRLARNHFGEGVAVLGARIVQLTWQSGLALVYDAALRPVGSHAYAGEGWGLASDGAHWYMSDGSHRIAVRDRDSFAVTRHLEVRDGAREVAQLNELEHAEGMLFANVWRTDRIAAIDPVTGRVRGWLDLAALRRGFVKPDGWDEREHVLNGIAFDPGRGHYYVTGKCWPVLFELRLRPPAP